MERCPLLALIFIALGPAISPAQGQSFEFAFLGDNPYGGAFNVPKFQALIEDVNGWGDIEWGHRRQPGPHRKRDGHVRRGPHTWPLGGRSRLTGPVYGSSWVPGAPQPTVFAVGPGGADFSVDGGFSWRAADTRTYWAVSFVSGDRGWAVGPAGRITRFEFRGG